MRVRIARHSSGAHRPVARTLLLFLITLAHRGVAQEAEEILGTARTALGARDALVDRLEFTATYQERYRKNLMRSAPFVDRVQVLATTVEMLKKDGVPRSRYRLDILTTRDPDYATNVGPVRDEQIPRLRIEAVISREKCSSLTDAQDGTPLFGRITSTPHVVISAQPLYLLCLNEATPFAELESPSQLSAQVAGQVSGYGTVRIDWLIEGAPGPTGTAMKGSYWLAPSLGHAPVRTEMSRRVGSSGPWRTILSREAEEFTDHGGVWLPGKVVLKRSGAWDDGGYELQSELVATFEGWRVNHDVPPGRFEILFPDGTVILDETRGGERYVKGQISDASIAAHVEQARALSAEARPAMREKIDGRFQMALGERPFAWHRRTTWIVALIAGVLGCVILAILWIRKSAGAAS